MTSRRRLRHWRKRDYRRVAVVLAVIFVVGALALFIHLYQSGSTKGSSAEGSGDGSGAGLGLPTAGLSTTSIGGDSSILKVFPSQLTRQLGHSFRGHPGHTVILTVSASAPIARLGYLVPSADSNQYGDRRNVPAGWSQTFVARGPYGPYSAIFIQTDRAGTPVHCTVTVDGVEKDSQTISGEYGRGLCYG